MPEEVEPKVSLEPVDPQTEEDEAIDRIIKISNGEIPVDED